MCAGGLFGAAAADDPADAAQRALLFGLCAHDEAAAADLRLRIGLHTGPVVSGAVGATRRVAPSVVRM